VLALAAEEVAGAEPLLEHVVAGGRRVARPPLVEARDRCSAALASLPSGLRSLAVAPATPFPVRISPALRDLAEAVGGPLGGAVVGEERLG
jgi:hypothetical protein